MSWLLLLVGLSYADCNFAKMDVKGAAFIGFANEFGWCSRARSFGLIIYDAAQNKRMGATYRFLGTIDEGSSVLNWFRSLPEKPTESPRDSGAVFYFREFGSLQADLNKSPVVTVFIPVTKRGVLTTIGEVHFLTTPMSAFPRLNRISKRFKKWLGENTCVFSRRLDFVREWDYFLEGSVRNRDSDIFALAGGLAALKSGS